MARERVAVVERKGKVSSDEAAAGLTTIYVQAGSLELLREVG